MIKKLNLFLTAFLAITLIVQNSIALASGGSLSFYGWQPDGNGSWISTIAASKIIPGATSLSIRNNADSASNLTITDAGLVTVPVGNLGVTAGNLTFGAATASIIPGATSIVVRNNANNATNLSLTDAGILTEGQSAGAIISGIAAIPANVSSATGASPGFLAQKNVSSNSDHFDGVETGANTSGVTFQAFKTRANDGSAGTIINSGDTGFNLVTRGADGTAYRNMASMSMNSDGTPGSGSMPGNILFNTVPSGSTTLTQVLKMDSSQNSTFSGNVTSSSTGTIGWSIVAASTATCTATCTSACVAGFTNASGSAVTAVVGCATSITGSCLCAGAS